jgi:hypothetical protein
LSLQTNAEEKKSAALILRNQGNWIHNSSVLAAGQGEMIVQRAPMDISTFDYKDYTACDLCLGFFKDTEMYRHNCPKAGPGQKPRVKAGKVLVGMAESGMSQGMATILVGLQEDEVGRIAKSDELLLSWLDFHCKTGFWRQTKWRSQTRAKMRLGARVLLELQKIFPNASLREVLVKANFDYITEAAKACALSSDKSESLQVPLKVGHLINSLLQRMHSQASIANDDAACKAVQELRELMKTDWGTAVTTACHYAIKEKRRNEDPCIPTTEDNVKFAKHCASKLESTLQEYNTNRSIGNYRELQKAALARLIQYNRRRGGEVAEVRVQDFVKGMERSDLMPDEVFKSLKPEEQEAAKNHRLIVVNGKCNKNNYIILDGVMVAALELIIRDREMAEIDPENHFIFAIPNSKSSTLSGSKVRGQFAADAEVRNMQARGMRKYVATTLQVNVINCYLGFI